MQFFSSHGYVLSLFCPECVNVEEKSEHALLECTRYEEVCISVGRIVYNIVEAMYFKEDTWNAVDMVVTRILS